MSGINFDRGVAVALIFVSAAAIWKSLAFPGDAGVFPIAMATILILSSSILLLRASARGARNGGDVSRIELPRLLTWIGLAAALWLLVWQVDFYFGIFLFTFMSYAILAKRRLVFSLLLAAGCALALFAVFDLLLGVPTPSNIQFYMNRF